MKYSRCPSGKNCDWGGETTALYWKVAGTMKVRAVFCTRCLAVYLKGPEKWTVYRLSDKESIPLPRSQQRYTPVSSS